MYCCHCGSQVPAGSVFCPACGQNASKGSTGAVTDTRRIVEILLVLSYAVLIAVSLFLPWLKLDAFSSSMTWSFFEIVKLFFSGEGLAIVTALTLAMIVTAAGTVITIIISLIDLADPSKDAPRSACTATAWAIVLSVLFIIAYYFVRNEDDIGRFSTLGAGLILCLASSIVYLFLLSYIPRNLKYNSVSIASDKQVVCPLCGTSYTKISAATPCPRCNGLGLNHPDKKATPGHVSCPFCKQKYPAGTIYCPTCNARIGSSDSRQPSRPPVIQPTPTPPVSVTPAPSGLNTQPKPAAPPQPQAGSQDYVFCLQCGKKLPATAKFCGKCGAQIINN